MIYWVAARRHAASVRDYLSTLGAPSASGVELIRYRQLLQKKTHPRGVYLFSDLESLSAKEADHAALVRAKLITKGSRALNHPQTCLRRFELLDALYQKGAIDHRVYRVEDLDGAIRFPVYLSREGGPEETPSPLIGDRTSLARALAEQRQQGILGWLPWRAGPAIVTECPGDPGGDGLWREYSAFAIKGQIVPMGLQVGQEWPPAKSPMHTEKSLAEERAYVLNNPHEVPLRELFSVAEIEFGRIDYSLFEGRLSVRRIVTNPAFLPKGEDAKRHQAVHRLFATSFDQALRRLDSEEASPVAAIRRAA